MVWNWAAVDNHDALHNNKNGSIARLSGLVRRLQHKPELLDEYDNLIQDQLKQGIIEKTTQEPGEKEFYIPHKPVVRESAESTKVWIVFDASAKGTEKSPSLNDCLQPGETSEHSMFQLLNGPGWLSEKSHWPDEISIASSEESEKEARFTKDVLAVSVIEVNHLDTLLYKFSFWKTIRVTAIILRFLKNCKSKRIDHRKETLITAETEKTIKYWVTKTQKMFENTEKFNEDQERLNLVKDSEDIYTCHGRI